jgi:Na+-driven multidrug efflux pump
LRPLTIINGILLGSAASIAAGLSVVLLLFFLLIDEHPRLAEEYPSLVVSTLIFLGLTAVCAFSFVGLLKQWRSRWLGQALMWLGLVLVVAYYLPD